MRQPRIKKAIRLFLSYGLDIGTYTYTYLAKIKTINNSSEMAETLKVHKLRDSNTI